MQATGNNSVYFIGAGLSRSLQRPGYPIPLMGDFMQVMADYALKYDDAVIAKLLALAEGAGKGRCLYCSEPEEARVAAGEYWDIIGLPAPSDLERRAALRRLAAAVCSRDPESVEDLLRRADNPEEPNRAAAGGGPGRLAQQFRYAIARLFFLLGWNADLNPLERFLRARFALGGRHDFVSFNYDLLLDRAVQSCAKVRWHPSTGYGFKAGHGLIADPRAVAGGAPGGAAQVPTTVPIKEAASDCWVLKPHGSVNWLLPLRQPYNQGGSGLELCDEPVIIPMDHCGRLRSCDLAGTFNHVRWGAPAASGDVQCYIVPPAEPAKAEAPPTAVAGTAHLESEVLHGAHEIFVIGWSAPTTDGNQRELIRKARQGRPARPPRAVLVSLGQDDGLLGRVAETLDLPPGSVEAHWDGFKAFADRVAPVGA